MAQLAEVQRRGGGTPFHLALWGGVVSQHEAAAKLSGSQAGDRKGVWNEMCGYQ